MWCEFFGFFASFLLVSSLHFPFDRLDQNDYRLPEDIVPTKYIVELQPDFYSKNESLFTYKGKVQIHLYCKRSTDQIVLHSSELDILENRTVYRHVGSTQNKTIPLQWIRDGAKDFLIANLSEPTAGGETYVLDIEFSGKLVEKLTGIYVRNYQTDNNETEFFVATNLAPTFARYVFPCFDEPGFKAIFQFNILRKPPYHTLSNMPVNATKDRGDGWVVDEFQPTMKMSTYILGIFISKFKSVSRTTRSGVLNRVWSRPEDVHTLDFFADYTSEVLQSLEDYFGFAFPLTKIDHIAHPGFMYNAMENWGIIMYKHDRLMYKKGHGEPLKLNTHMYTAAHETGHMLFGNLVTMKWWTDLFLKEGFAELNAVSILGPKGSPLFSEEFFCTQKRRLSRRLDSYAEAKPTRYPYAETRVDILKAYNKYTLYAKGGTINRMFQFAIGNETYKLGLQNYLKAKEYEAADQWDLLENLQKAVKSNGDRDKMFDLNVTSYLGSWLWQPGFPVVTVDSNTDFLIIQQERFLYPGYGKLPYGYDENDARELQSIKYDIPFFMRHNCNGKMDVEADIRTFWLPRTAGTSRTKNPCGRNGWLIGNAFVHGYYRVNYKRSMWMNIIDQLHKDHTVFTTAERANLLDDAFALVRYGKMDFDLFLKLISYIKKERRFLPWNVFLEEIEEINLVSQSLTTKFSPFIRDMVSEVYHSVKWDSLTDHVESELARIVIEAACSHGYPPCLDEADKLVKHVLDGNDKEIKISKLNETILCTSRMKMSDAEREKTLMYIFHQAQNKSFDEKQLPKLFRLVCNQNLEVPKKLFRMVFSNVSIIDIMPFNALHLLLNRVAGHVNTTSFVLDTFSVHYDVINQTSVVRSLLAARSNSQRLVNGMTSEKEREKFLHIMTAGTNANSTERYFIKDSHMNVLQDQITTNLAWREMNKDELMNLNYIVMNGKGRWETVIDSAHSNRASVLVLVSLLVILCFS